MNTILLKPRLSAIHALTTLVLLSSAMTPVWARNGQDMPNMPGMDTSESKPKEAPTPQQKKPATKPKQNDMGDMPGMHAPAPEPSPSPSPEKMDQNVPGTDKGASGNQSTQGMNGTANMPGMGSMNTGSLMVMSSNGMAVRVGSSDTNITPMGQSASGTSWNPASSPMHMYHKIAGGWLLMFHFNLIAGVNSQGGPLGHTRFESQNWFMPMAFHKLGRGTIQLRGMFSAEPFTFAPGGSPELFQTGETYKGQPLRNAQHPHDLFMELSATYTMPIGERATWFAYFGYPGEPALGPPAFMHRWSASENPSAPLAHHLEDSTHISFGVLTSGFTYRKFKLEGSIFNGQEPDENRYNFEAHPWQSHSARLSFAPDNNWTAQVSYGFLKRPEALAPDTDIRRATASIQYHRPFERGWWATSLIWGHNHLSSPGSTANQSGYTAETTVNFLDKNYLYTRLELVDRNELLDGQQLAQLGFTIQPTFRIAAYTAGGDRDVWNTDHLSVAVGSDITLYTMPAVLDTIYGQHPVSWRLFFRIRPGKMKMNMSSP